MLRRLDTILHSEKRERYIDVAVRDIKKWAGDGVNFAISLKWVKRLTLGCIGTGEQTEWPRPTRCASGGQREVVWIIPSRSKSQQWLVVIRSETKNQHEEVLQIFRQISRPRRP